MAETPEKPAYDRARRTLSLSYPVEKIWAALTDPIQLTKWFADGAEIELRPGGKYAFWGKQVWRTLTEADATQKLTAVEPNQSLCFIWHIGEVDNLWSWELESTDAGSKVSIQVERPGNEDSYIYWVTLDTVELALLSLREFLFTGKAVLPDYRDLKPEARLKITIDADPADVFAALTEPNWLDKWIGEGAKVDLKVGGTYDYGWTETVDDSHVPAGPEKVVALEPGRLLQHNWHYSKEPETVVEWLVEGVAGATIVRLTHVGFTLESDPPAYNQGWMTFLYRLKAVVEGLPMAQKE